MAGDDVSDLQRQPVAGRVPPLVYASPRALKQGRNLLPGRVLENVVGAAIRAGHTRFAPHGRAMVRGDGWVAHALLADAQTPGRKCWTVVEVTRR